MRPLHLVLGSVLTAAMVSGCTSQSPEQSPPASETVTEAAAITDTELPPGFYFNGEFVELGDFDPDGPVNLINMCDDLPDEVLHKAGMKRVAELSTSKGPHGINCLLHSVDDQTRIENFEIMTDFVPIAQFHQHGYVLDSASNSQTPGAITHVFSPEGFGSECWASVSTELGRVGVGFSSFTPTITQAEFCAEAIRGLDSIYTQLRGT